MTFRYIGINNDENKEVINNFSIFIGYLEILKRVQKMMKWIAAVLLGAILIVGLDMLSGGQFRLGYPVVAIFIYLYCSKKD